MMENEHRRNNNIGGARERELRICGWIIDLACSYALETAPNSRGFLIQSIAGLFANNNYEISSGVPESTANTISFAVI